MGAHDCTEAHDVKTQGTPDTSRQRWSPPHPLLPTMTISWCHVETCLKQNFPSKLAPSALLNKMIECVAMQAFSQIGREHALHVVDVHKERDKINRQEWLVQINGAKRALLTKTRFNVRIVDQTSGLSIFLQFAPHVFDADMVGLFFKA